MVVAAFCFPTMYLLGGELFSPIPGKFCNLSTQLRFYYEVSTASSKLSKHQAEKPNQPTLISWAHVIFTWHIWSVIALFPARLFELIVVFYM